MPFLTSSQADAIPHEFAGRRHPHEIPCRGNAMPRPPEVEGGIEEVRFQNISEMNVGAGPAIRSC